MNLRFTSVSVRRGRRVVLDIPSLVLPLDGVTAVMGPNGSGKTTLLRVIAGLERDRDGLATVEAEIADAVAAGPPRRPAVAMAFQRAPLLQGTVRWNLELALSLRHVPAPERPERLGRAAGLLGIDHLLGRDAGGLSSGEAQRVNVARALAVPADLVLLDEPFAGLDGPSARELLRLLPHALEEAGATVLLVTHQPAEALRLADRAVVLREGTVVAAGPLPDLFLEPPGRDVAEIVGLALPADRADGALVSGAEPVPRKPAAALW